MDKTKDRWPAGRRNERTNEQQQQQTKQTTTKNKTKERMCDEPDPARVTHLSNSKAITAVNFAT